MLYKKTPHIKSIIRKNSSFNLLINHSKQLIQINEIVRHTLTQPLQSHCKVANYRENILYLHVDSPAWATRLRFALPELTEALKKNRDFSGLTQIQIHQVKSQPSARQNETKTPKRERLSKDTAEQLNCLADSVTDQKLASALRRLAQRTH